MEQGPFVRGALLLALAGSVSRVLGLCYVVLLPRIIEDTGYGLFHMVKPIYYLAVVVAVAGMPVAISRLVAEKAAQGLRDGVWRVLNTALAFLFALGALVSVALVGSARWVAREVLLDPGAYYPLVALAPSVLLMGLASAWRGFFQGLQHMGPSALSQVSEQVVRVLATVGGAVLFLPWGAELAAAGAAFGSVAGAMAGLLTLLWMYAGRKQQLLASIPGAGSDGESARAVLARLLAFAFPLVLGSLLWPAMGSLDAVIVPARLREAGLDTEGVRKWYGYLGMASQVVHFPTVVSMALAASLVPAVARAASGGKAHAIRQRVAQALRLSTLFAVPAGIGMFALASPIAAGVFGYPSVAVPLRILACGSVFLVWFQTSTGVFHGLGRVGIPFLTLLTGMAVKAGLSYYLTALPEYGIRGAAWGTVCGFATPALLNMVLMCRLISVPFDMRSLLVRPGLAALAMGAAVGAAYRYLETGLGLGAPGAGSSPWAAFSLELGAVVFLVPLGAAVYGVALALLGGFAVRDLQHVPWVGPALRRWVTNRGWFR